MSRPRTSADPNAHHRRTLKDAPVNAEAPTFLPEDPTWSEATVAAYLALQLADAARIYQPQDLHTIWTLHGYLDRRDKLVAGLSDDPKVARTQLLGVRVLQSMIDSLSAQLLLLPRGRQAHQTPNTSPPKAGALALPS